MNKGERMSDPNSTPSTPNDDVPGYQPPPSPEPTTPSTPPAPGGYEPPAATPPAWTPPATGGYEPPAPAAGSYPPPPAGGGFPEPPGPGAYPPPPGGFGQQPGYPDPNAAYGGGYPPAPLPAVGGGGGLADWPKRALGGLIDYVAPAIVISVLANLVGSASSTLGGLVSFVLVVGWWVYLGYKSGTTGVTFGRSIAKTKLISAETGQVVGTQTGIIRQFAHIIDSIICYVGWLFPLWDQQKQTLADKIMKTVVVDNSADPNAGSYSWN